MLRKPIAKMTYLQKRLTGECQIPSNVYANDFTSDKHNNIVINYLNEQGNNLIARSKEGTPWNYRVIRVNDDYLRTLPKEWQNKYKNPKGLENQIYATGLHRFFAGQTVETLVVTEGQIKSYVACFNGIATIGITGLYGFGKNAKKGNETADDTYLPHPELIRLCELYKVKNLIYLHDSDYLSSEKIERNDQFYTSVKRFRQVCEVLQVNGIYKHVANNSKRAKGLDDLILAYKNELPRIQSEISTLVYCKGSFFHTYDLNNLETLRNVFYAPFAPIASHIIETFINECKTLTNDLKNELRVILKAPTNSGKTTYFLNDFLNSLPEDEILIFAVPTIVIANQHQGKPNVCIVTGTIDSITLINAEHSKCFVTTYDSVQKAIDLLQGKKFRLVIDECHNLVSAISYRKEVLQKMYNLQHLPNCIQTILTSATPHPFFKCLGFSEIEIDFRDVKKVKTLPIFYKKNCLSVVLNEILTSAKDSFVVCQIDNYKQLLAISKELNSNGIENVVITSKRKDLQSDKDYIDIINYTPLRDDLKVILCTKLLNEGISLNNPKDVTYILANDKGQHKNLVQSIQIIKRVRNATNIIFKPILNIDRKDYAIKNTTAYELFMREYSDIKKYDINSNINELAETQSNINTDELKAMVKNLTLAGRAYSKSHLLFADGIDILSLMKEVETEHSENMTSKRYLKLLSDSGLFDLQGKQVKRIRENEGIRETLIENKKEREELRTEVCNTISHTNSEILSELFAISEHTQKKNRPVVSTARTNEYNEKKEVIDSNEFKQAYRKIQKLQNFGINTDVAKNTIITKKQVSECGMMHTVVMPDITFNKLSQFISLVICRQLSGANNDLKKNRKIKKLISDYNGMLGIDTVNLDSKLTKFYDNFWDKEFTLNDLRASLETKSKKLSNDLLLNILHSFYDLSSHTERVYIIDKDTKEKKQVQKTTYEIMRVIPLEELINSVGIEKSVFVSNSQ